MITHVMIWDARASLAWLARNNVPPRFATLVLAPRQLHRVLMSRVPATLTIVSVYRPWQLTELDRYELVRVRNEGARFVVAP